MVAAASYGIQIARLVTQASLVWEAPVSPLSGEDWRSGICNGSRLMALSTEPVWFLWSFARVHILF